MKQPVRMYTAAAVLLLLLTAGAFAQPTFINPIPIPPLVDADSGVIHLEMRVMAHKFNPADTTDSLNGGTGQPNGITTYAYNVAGDSTMTMLGPTLKVHTLDSTHITVKNLIGTPTTTHWHGAEVPAQMDGGPHQAIQPDSTWYVDFLTLDSASTMWYHPHYHNMTVQHVQKGLSGMIFAEQATDTLRHLLPHTYGADDIPVIIGDLGFTSTSNRTAGMVIDTFKGKRPYNLVNGVTNPYVQVPAHMVRLRILNGSTRKGVFFGVSDSLNNPFADLQNFYLVAGDGGYTLKPDTLTRLLTGPGTRHEIVLNLSGYSPGQVLYLSNLKDSLPNSVVGSTLNGPNGPNHGRDSTGGNAFLQLRVVADSVIQAQYPGYTPITTLPQFTTTWTAGLADTSNIARHRQKLLVMTTDTVNNKPVNMYTIDSTAYEMETINDTICVNSKEIWSIHNTTDVAHPFHIHKIQFRVLDVVDSTGDTLDLPTYGLNGPKDDVLILPGWTLRFLGQYDDYPSPIEAMNSYMYHCHILTHEDSVGGGMMHQFVVADCISTGVSEAQALSPGLVLYADRAEGALHLKATADDASTLTMIDLRGRRVRAQELPAFDGDARIDTRGLPCGVYLVEWRTRQGVRTGKVVLK